MASRFVREISDAHETLKDSFDEYRDKLTDVLFYGERISRSELQEGKDTVIRGIRTQIEAVQQILLPAVTSQNGDEGLHAVNVLAVYQESLIEILDKTDENIDFFANPDAPKEDRNDAARETLKDLYRLDGLLKAHFKILEEQFLEPANYELDEDEKDQFLAEYNSSLPAS